VRISSCDPCAIATSIPLVLAWRTADDRPALRRFLILAAG
jgi:hypothetical protein